ncbi:Putative F-box/LRR-repeat protein At3g18150 [Linum perenne]
MNNSGSGNLGRAKKRHRGGASIDRLSHLPDSVLYHILSFLDTIVAVKTSVLSRRWRCAWKHVPVLNISFPFRLEYPQFKRYVDKVLSLRYPLNVSTIRYEDFFDEDDGSLLIRVVEYAFSHATQHLMIYMERERGEDDYIFPKLFDSILDSNLKTLDLRGFNIDRRFKSFGFRVLKTLELSSCMLSFHEEILDPFSEFPCLENLVLESCPQSHERLRISGLKLRNLKILQMDVDKFEIFAPNLISFTLSDFNEGLEFSEIMLPSLEHVHIQVTPDHFYVEHDITKENWVFMFQGFRHVKSLTLSRRIIKQLCKISEFLVQQHSPFTRLEKLNLGWTSTNIPYKVVNYFLKQSSSSNPSINLFKESSR